ncbi:DNA ligase 1 isoform X1 [Eupeodes corollae]|uniref:DNA ligase 1 isoform X1 n=1 Tax=Eupeodes corollae TaxID=290404 RepID=UPI00248FE9AE|nr:DNA ligase 1 isoform X1 [Eupeodes corollae]
MARKLIFLFLIHVWLEGSLAQHSPFSLQAAVDALHRREAQLALKDNYNVPMRYGIPQGAAAGVAQEQDYWDDDTEVGPASFTPTQHNNNRHRLNRILAKYLAREEDNARNTGGLGTSGGYEFDEDNYLPEEKKRSSFFRERDGKDDPSAVLMREQNNQPYDHSELTDQFLKEIEEARELDREERYKEALRRIWERYQQQENELEGDIFEDQKRMTPQPNYYIGPLMQKKRTYPVLPWLPMSRRKRFPVAKRSPKMPFDETSKVSVERVPEELRELFGKSTEEKKKRSTDDQSAATTTEKKNETSTSATIEPQTEHPPHGGHHHKEHKHRKRSDHVHESQEEDEEDSEEHEPEHEEHEEHEEEDEEEHDDFEDEDEAQKKKREVSGKRMQKRSNLEVVKEDQILPGDLSNFRGKKSIQWSKYFGIDRRKKSGYESGDSKKQESIDDDEIDEEKRRKKNVDPERLNNMGKKLQSIEDLIIDETVKYTGAHEGIADPEEIARLKDHVVSRLATAYSLEKMRRALEKLRQSVDNENHLLRNVVESEPKSDDDSDIENQKRLSVKKEKVEFQGLHHSINTPNNEKSKDLQGNSMTSDIDEDTADKKKKKEKKSNGYQRYPEIPNEMNDFEEELGAGHYEPLNDAYLGNKNYVPGSSNQCPLIDSMAQRCRGVDLLSGDINQELLPICGVHQICYLCGTSQVACDFQYLAEADSICGHNNECQSAARSVLMILRGSPGPQLGPKECIKNPCLNRAMREIGL